jgi:glutathione S-transferase
MAPLTDDPAFQTYAVCSAILAIKMLLAGNYTTVQRFRSKTFLSEEDVRLSGGVVGEHPAVARALNIQRNDLENIPLFWIVGLIYVLDGASPGAAAAYCWTFTVSRLVHWFVYLAGLQPWRAIAYTVGYLAILGMAAQIIL